MIFSHICDLIEANPLPVILTILIIAASTAVVYYKDKAHD